MKERIGQQNLDYIPTKNKIMNKQEINKFFDAINGKRHKQLELSYTDVIAIMIKEKLKTESEIKLGSIKWDLHPEDGYYLSSKKTLSIKYQNKDYKITIEENGK